MTINLGRTVAALSALQGCFCSVGPWAGHGSRGACAAPSVSLMEQALAQVTSEDEAVREAAIRVLIEQGDASLVPRLEEIRANADRSIRQAIKPLMDLLKNRANLASRRHGRAPLGGDGSRYRPGNPQRFHGWIRPQ